MDWRLYSSNESTPPATEPHVSRLLKAAALSAATNLVFRRASALLAFACLAVPQMAIADILSTGTGFAISFDGILITNNHVIDGCSRIWTRLTGDPRRYEAQLVARDPKSDLAAIKINRVTGQRQLPIPRVVLRRDTTVEQGETAITYGFPLHGVLASGGNLTTGIVTALTGLGDDPGFIQISTPVQPGNSGGAVLDRGGHGIGVVVAKIDAIAVMRRTGDVPQNVNFAVSLGSLKTFLVKNNIEFAEEPTDAERPVTEIAQRARLVTYLVECQAR